MLIVCSMLVTVALIEAFFFILDRDRFYVWPPNLEAAFDPAPNVMPGVSGKSFFFTNTEGMRGDDYSLDYGYKILAVGGSTTECLYLDQSEAWPQLLQQRINRDTPLYAFVGNVGKSGLTTREHYYQIKHLLQQYPDCDMVILLIGINDLLLHISDPAYRPFDFSDTDRQESVLKRAFDIRPLHKGASVPLYKQTKSWQLLRASRNKLFGTACVQDEAGKWYARVRRYRAQAKRIAHELPDLRAGLSEYRNNIKKIIDITDQSGVRLLLLTQPFMWDNVTDVHKDLFWVGGIGDFMNGAADTYYAIPVLARALEQYNDAVRSFCAGEQAECVDLAAQLPKNTDVFYDDVHFNESGSKAVAGLIVGYLEKTVPFKKRAGNVAAREPNN